MEQDHLAESLLYRGRPRFAEIANIVTVLASGSSSEVRVRLFQTSGAVDKVAPKVGFKSGLSYNEYRRTPEFVSGFLKRTVGRKKRREVSGSFVLSPHSSHKNTWALVTDAGAEFIKNPFVHYLRAFHPRPSYGLLKLNDLDELLRGLQESVTSSNGEIRVSQVGHKGLIRSAAAQKKFESERIWTDISIEEALQLSRETDQWITDMTVHIMVAKARYGTIKIGRGSSFVFKGFLPRLGIARMLETASRIGQARYEFLRERARTAENKFQSRPFIIEFGAPILSSADHFVRLRSGLLELPSLSVTTLHGNPFYHAALVDFQDGSTFEIMVTDSSKLTIFPQGRTTVRALQRVCSKIFMTFREGEFKEL